MAAQPRPDYLMLDNDSTLWVTHHVSCSTIKRAILKREDIAFHMRNRTFSDVFVFQRLNIDPDTNERTLREGDDLGPAFVLEPVVEERMQLLTLSRISRVKEIKFGDAVISAREPIAPRSAKSRSEIEQARRRFHENFMKLLP